MTYLQSIRKATLPKSNDAFRAAVDRYVELYDGARQEQCNAMVQAYYDFATILFEKGWGDSFHFAPRTRGQSLRESLVHYQQHLAARMGARSGMVVLDAGCGIGGPMRTIAKHTGARIVGLNISSVQARRGRELNEQAGLAAQCTIEEGDFLAMPFSEATFDAAYAIESAPHATSKAQLFAELFRVLKPGAMLVGHDWCLTERFDARVPQHAQAKHDIQKGISLPDISTLAELQSAVSGAGFVEIEVRDLAPTCSPETPWHLPLSQRISLRDFPRSEVGGWVTQKALRALELAALVPPGITDAQQLLAMGRRGLVDGGRSGVFTALAFFFARKPAPT
jgi:sterol 24-C-methyltransferase